MIYLELFLTFFKIGLFTIGGGYAMLPLIREEVALHGWASAEELINFIAVSESTPGPFAVNIATFVGRTTAGIPGALCATLGVVLPSFIVILIVSKLYDKFRKSKIVQGAMSGVKPAVIGLIAAALISLGKQVMFPDGYSVSAATLVSILIFIVTAVLAFRKKNPILLIGISAVAGIVAGYAIGL